MSIIRLIPDLGCSLQPIAAAHCSPCLCCSAGAGTERGIDVMNGGKVHSAPSSAFRSSVVFDYEMWLLQNLAQSWFKHRDPCDFQLQSLFRFQLLRLVVRC